MKKERVIIYVRVSSNKQTSERQRVQLLNFAEKQNMEVVKVISEQVSAFNGKKREGIELMKSYCEAQSISSVLVLEISRLGRKTAEVLSLLEWFADRKVNVFCLNYNLNTLINGKRNPLAQFLLTLLAEIARMESETLSERINSGLENAKRKGITLGRPKNSTMSKNSMLRKYSKAVKLLNDGLSVRQIAKLCDVAPGTVQSVKKLIQ